MAILTAFGRNSRLLRLTVVFAGTFASCAASCAATPEIQEYTLKAAFLLNFARLVEWPEASFGHPGDPIVICVAGRNPFGTSLEDTVRGQKIAGRAVVVHQISAQEVAGCQIVFIPASESKQQHALLEKMGLGSVLTVGETPGFTSDGGMIGLRISESRLRFRIAADRAQRAGLKMSSKLLSLAESGKD